MPCGGIYPMGDADKYGRDGYCFHCEKPGADHFCEEWDTYLHAECVAPFLVNSEEGRIVVKHRHEIHVVFSDPDQGRGW